MESIQQFAQALSTLMPAPQTSQTSAYCDEIQTQLHLKTLEQGRAYIQERLHTAQEAGTSQGGFTEKLGNWAKGYSYIDNGAKESESDEFQKILGCLDKTSKDRLIPAMVLECELPGMRSGTLCWMNTKSVAETGIMAATPLFTKQALNEVALKSGSGLRSISEHAVERMLERGISRTSIEEAIQKGISNPGNLPDRIVYDLPANLSSTGRGIRVVVEETTGKVITVIDKGKDFLTR